MDDPRGVALRELVDRLGTTVAQFSAQTAKITAASAQISVISTKTNVQIGTDNDQKQTAVMK